MDYAIYQLKSCVDKYKYLGVDMRDFAQSMQDNLRDFINLNDFEIIKSGIFEEDFSDAQKVVDCGYGQLKYDIDRLDVIHTWWNQRYNALPRDWKGDLTASYEYIVQLNGHYYLRHYSKYQKKYWSQIDHNITGQKEKQKKHKKDISVLLVMIIVIIGLVCLIASSFVVPYTINEAYEKEHHVYEFACPKCGSNNTEGFHTFWTNDGMVCANSELADYTIMHCNKCSYCWNHYLEK